MYALPGIVDGAIKVSKFFGRAESGSCSSLPMLEATTSRDKWNIRLFEFENIIMTSRFAVHGRVNDCRGGAGVNLMQE